jgi:hypothetical protein
LLWITLLICSLYTGLSLTNFYKTNRLELLDGSLKMPGISFDLANSLDQLLIAIPFLIMIAGSRIGSDYSQRTNCHWLMRASRSSSLLSKFSLLVLITIAIQIITLVMGWAVGFYFKSFVYHVPNVMNINWLAIVAAPLYMTLVVLPYMALTLVVAVLLRSTFWSIVITLVYTQILEFLFAGLFHGSAWTRWLFTNVHFSASFLLNSIGDRAAQVPTNILSPGPALLTAAAYTFSFILFAIWLYRRQDLAG